MPGFILTALVALTLDDAERLCTRLNARLGLDRDAWWAIDSPLDGWRGRRAPTLTREPRPVLRGLRIDTSAGSKSTC